MNHHLNPVIQSIHNQHIQPVRYDTIYIMPIYDKHCYLTRQARKLSFYQMHNITIQELKQKYNERNVHGDMHTTVLSTNPPQLVCSLFLDRDPHNYSSLLYVHSLLFDLETCRDYIDDETYNIIKTLTQPGTPHLQNLKLTRKTTQVQL